MFQKIFNPDNALMITMTQVTDCIFLSLFWLLGCAPVLTLGASSAALYDAVYYGFRKGDKHCWSRFLRTFRQNLKNGIGPTAAYLALAAAGGWALIQVWNAAARGQMPMMVFSGIALVGVLGLGILSVLFPMMSRFENSLGVLLKNTLLLALGNMPRTMGLGLITCVSVLLCFRFVFPLFFLPALSALISTLLLEPMFRPYMPEEPSQDAA